MRIFLIVVILVFIGKLSSGQSFSSADSLAASKCTKQFTLVSYFWKIDSLASNGYRMSIEPRLLACVIDGASAKTILNILGKPHKIIEFTEVLSYIYYVYDGKYIDSTKYKGAYGYNFMVIDFDKRSKKLVSISHGCGQY